MLAAGGTKAIDAREASATRAGDAGDERVEREGGEFEIVVVDLVGRELAESGHSNLRKDNAYRGKQRCCPREAI